MPDGFGEMLRTCWQRGPDRGLALQVIERDDGFVSVEDAYRYFTRPDEWVECERRAVELARGRVLDVGCAVGRHMLALAGSCEVVGIDPSPGAVAIARSQGLDARIGTWFDRLLMSADELARLVITSEDWAMDSCSEPDGLGFYLAVLRRKPGVGPAARVRRDT